MDLLQLGRSRSDCAPPQLDMLLAFVHATADLDGAIVEIGSWKCGASMMMAAANPDKQVYAFDTFGGLPYGNGKGFENFADVDWEEIKKATEPYWNLRLARGRHEDTIPHLEQMPLSLIFMDSDHYSSHKVALTHLAPMLSPGGYVLFHDWTFPDVQKAVMETLSYKDFDCSGGPQMLNMGVARRR